MNHFELFKNLMVMAAADGKLTGEEIEFLVTRAERWGITDAQVNEAIENAKQIDPDVVMPESKEEAVEMLRLWIRTMAADGEIAEEERRLFAVAAVKLGITPQELDDIIDSVV